MLILVVDTNPDTSELWPEMLCHLGHDALLASNRPAAIAMATRYGPDAIMVCSDTGANPIYSMLARQLRLLPGLDQVRLICVSNYGAAEDVLSSKQAGFDHRLSKPVSLNELERMLNDHGQSEESERCILCALGKRVDSEKLTLRTHWNYHRRQ